jgi:hypothetical protein
MFVSYFVVFRCREEHNFSMSLLKDLLTKLKDLLTKLQRLVGRPAEPPEPHDPYAGVRVPVKEGPKGRSGAVALAEPDEN